MPHKTETYQHAIGGLLQERAEMMEEMAATRKRLAILSNDVEALDRVLETLGYQGDVKLTPRVPRIILFYRGEMRQFLIGQASRARPANVTRHRGTACEDGGQGRPRPPHDERYREADGQGATPDAGRQDRVPLASEDRRGYMWRLS